MKGKRKETKIGIIAFIIFLLLRLLGSYVEVIQTSNLIHFIMGMLVGLSLLAVIFEFIPEHLYERIKESKSSINK